MTSRTCAYWRWLREKGAGMQRSRLNISQGETMEGHGSSGCCSVSAGQAHGSGVHKAAVDENDEKR